MAADLDVTMDLLGESSQDREHASSRGDGEEHQRSLEAIAMKASTGDIKHVQAVKMPWLQLSDIVLELRCQSPLQTGIPCLEHPRLSLFWRDFRRILLHGPPVSPEIHLVETQPDAGFQSGSGSFRWFCRLTRP